MFGRSSVRPQPPRDILDPFSLARAQMVELQLHRRGVHDPAVLNAMLTIPRHLFIAPELQNRAYEDEALPSHEGQTISQPYMVATMTQELVLRPGDRVLEIGTGTGYQTAILAAIVGPHGRVFSIERFPALAEAAQRHLAEIRLSNFHIFVGDGSLGWPATDGEEATFNRILVTAGAPAMPAPLLKQLADGGILIAPIGDAESQILTRVTCHGNNFKTSQLFSCRFVPLVGAHGWQAH